MDFNNYDEDVVEVGDIVIRNSFNNATGGVNVYNIYAKVRQVGSGGYGVLYARQDTNWSTGEITSKVSGPFEGVTYGVAKDSVRKLRLEELI